MKIKMSPLSDVLSSLSDEIKVQGALSHEMCPHKTQFPFIRVPIYVVATVLLYHYSLFKESLIIMSSHTNEEFKCKIDISIFINLRYLLLENKENNKKICDIFHHNFNNFPYVTSEVSLVLFCSIWWWTYFKNFEIGGVYRFFAFKLFKYSW